ncbi:MAG: hypothetical protein Kow0098_17390 [Ignavibacteriaceae bacterium]
MLLEFFYSAFKISFLNNVCSFRNDNNSKITVNPEQTPVIKAIVASYCFIPDVFRKTSAIRIANEATNRFKLFLSFILTGSREEINPPM